MNIKAILLTIVFIFLCISFNISAASYTGIPFVLFSENETVQAKTDENRVAVPTSGRNILSDSAFADESIVYINDVSEYKETDVWAIQGKGSMASPSDLYGRDGMKSGVRVELSSEEDADFFIRTMIPGSKYYYFSVWAKLESGSVAGRQLTLSVYDSPNSSMRGGAKSKCVVDLAGGAYLLQNEWKQYAFIIHLPKGLANYYFEPRIHTTSSAGVTAMTFDITEVELYEVSIAETQEMQEDATIVNHPVVDATPQVSVIREVKPRPGSMAHKDTEFSDLDGVQWAEYAIKAFYKWGIVDGVTPGEFRPHDSVTREQFAKMLTNTFDWLDPGDCDFMDVPKTKWSYPYIATALKRGVVTGVDETWFGAEDYIMRQDMAVMVYRALDSLLVRVESSFAFDSEGVSEYAANSVSRLCGVGILYPIDGGVKPRTEVKRADAVAVLYNALNYAAATGAQMVRYY
ncbi:MAG: S-layer homology domain-containing protein [Firmicutes bacterium]|nr:S-layer homology domain-containing protein [Bacillota bacterium]